MDRPRDMFTASGGTASTDVCAVTFRSEEAGAPQLWEMGRSDR